MSMGVCVQRGRELCDDPADELLVIVIGTKNKTVTSFSVPEIL